MIERPDPFDMLAAMAADDRGHESLDTSLAPGDDVRADELLARITRASVPTRPDSRVVSIRARRRRLVAAVGVVTVTIAGAAAATVWSRRPADAVTVLCYSSADAEPAAVVAENASPGITPAAQCAVPWTDGRLGSGDAPPLVACVNELDVTVVVPGEESDCGRLGWALAGNRTVVDDVDARVADEVPGSLGDCTNDLEQARATVAGVLADLGADAWTVRIAPDAAITEAEPCAAVTIDPVAREVLVGTVDPPGR